LFFSVRKPLTINDRFRDKIPHCFRAVPDPNISGEPKRMKESGDFNPAGVTDLLIGYANGNRAALDEMLPLVYDELRRLASHYLSKENPGHTLQTTALVHEAYVRLVDQRRVDWKNRAQFLGVAAGVMRHILLNHARHRSAAKRGGNAQRVSLSLVMDASKEPDVNLIALDEALTKFSELDSRKSRIVELKFFGGMTIEEIAELMQISNATVEREWNLARAWLYRELRGSE
jgi:RNA polymerase sigma-70 factor (ECF subfamily)